MWVYLIVYFAVNGTNLTPESCRQFKDRELAVFWFEMDRSEFSQHKRPYLALLDSVWVNKSIKVGDAIHLKKQWSNVRIDYKGYGLRKLRKSINGKFE